MAVADIPTKLESAQLLLEAHHDSPRIHTLTDSVFLAVFSLLHEIVKELNKRNLASMFHSSSRYKYSDRALILCSLAEKALQICFKGSDYGQEVSNAITNLDTKIAAFKEGVAISSAEKLGQIYRLVDLGRTEAQQGFAGEVSHFAREVSINSHAFRTTFKQSDDPADSPRHGS